MWPSPLILPPFFLLFLPLATHEVYIRNLLEVRNRYFFLLPRQHKHDFYTYSLQHWISGNDMALQRRGAFLLRQIRTEFSLDDMKKKAKEINRRNRSILQKRKRFAEPYPYSKAQYIDAFVQAQSARLAREQRLQELSTREKSLLTTIESSNPSPIIRNEGRHSLSCFSSTAGANTPVVFGSWRDGTTEVERACNFMDRNFHCIMRGATTPPAFSTPSLRRNLPMTLACVQQLLKYAGGDGPQGNTGETWSNRRIKTFNRTFASCVESACLKERDAILKLMGVVLQTAGERDWAVALQLYNKSVLPYFERHWIQQNHEKRREAVSFLVAVLCESIRSGCGGSMCGRCFNSTHTHPPYKAIEKLVKASREPLLPVAAAPVFSVLHPSDDTNAARGGSQTKATWVDAVKLVQCFQPQGQARTYLPSLAWAELLRAIRRLGGSLKEVQMVVDIITNPTCTKHGERHMHDTRIWNAYLASSDWHHALDLFSNQWKHYGVKETAETSAALMESLLRDGEWERSLDVFRRLQGKEGQLITFTSSVFTAAFRALEQQRDWNSFASLLLDSERFLAPLDISHDWELLSKLQAQRKQKGTPRSTDEIELWRTFVNELRGFNNVTKEMQLAISNALLACDPVKQREMQGEVEKRESLITAEELYSIM
ncbi:hypothetical protein, conserved [Trypanosoma brucei brucei TREU927]|uniref:Uncharacterized protein n=2 Tax=Trypanozoon TaxID=39700 RepID=Q586Q0_TRYB2|nr:hypothetical protein, conserved [Trypanosoma brucei brucei TREU927]AAQ15904.1 hypothetical protein, conserved [Trypanosoma brucei brucei TREU927]AAX80186.1 hypothetical protein, conserved [Trypanosoma brucei]